MPQLELQATRQKWRQFKEDHLSELLPQVRVQATLQTLLSYRNERR